jgi:hypothetical protein
MVALRRNPPMRAGPALSKSARSTSPLAGRPALLAFERHPSVEQDGRIQEMAVLKTVAWLLSSPSPHVHNTIVYPQIALRPPIRDLTSGRLEVGRPPGVVGAASGTAESINGRCWRLSFVGYKRCGTRATVPAAVMFGQRARLRFPGWWSSLR